MKDVQVTEKSQRVVAFLDRREVDFLDKLGKDALFSTGLKLSRTKLIAWLIDFAKGLSIDGRNIHSEKDLKYRIIKMIKHAAPPATEGMPPAHK